MAATETDVPDLATTRRLLAYREGVDDVAYQRLIDFLPARIFDSHIHTARPEHIGHISDERRASKLGFFVDVASAYGYNPCSVAQAVRRLLFPQQRVEGLYFGYPFRETDLAANNEYVAGLIRERGVAGLYMPRPDSSADELSAALDVGFVGFKPYPDLVPGKSFAEMRVADYVPDALWQVAHERNALVLVHLSRPGRLYDAVDIADMAAACERYPGACVIIAHIGRPYIPSMIADGVPEPYKRQSNLWFDICPICESGVLEVAIREVGPGRLLFGSDSPITYMHGRLGAWGGDRRFFSDMDFPWNQEREPADVEAGYTFFMYEQLLGLQAAAEATGLSRQAVSDILYDNAAALVDEAAGGREHADG